MSEKPQATREGGQEDLLEQVFTQGLEKMNAPAPAEPEPEAPKSGTPSADKPESSETPAPLANRKSAVYLYLLVLFIAAFLMLLLAYFIQQRSSETAISDLRDSMNLSRQELLDEIRELESQVRFYQSVDDNWMSVYLELEEEYARSVEDGEQLARDYYAAQEELFAWKSFWELERYYQAGDYKGCAAALLMQTMSHYSYRAPDSARQEEIVRAVTGAGIIDEEYYLHPADYAELLEAYYHITFSTTDMTARG